MQPDFFDRCRGRVLRSDPFAPTGRVIASVGSVIEAEGLPARIGSICRVEGEDGEGSFRAEVVGFRDQRFLLMPLGEAGGVGPGARIRLLRHLPDTPAGDGCLGRVLDPLGRPIDGGAPLEGVVRVPLYRRSEPALARRPISEILDVGVRAINGLLTLARGGRFGLFAGSGIGKSTLLGQIARHTRADVNVIALVGERGREVREFVEDELGEARERSVVVVATSDEAPLLRVRAAHAATAIAEQQRRRGRHVLLLMDSVTRFCAAQREIGLAAGEPPATRGYPPSVWSTLPRLLERAGTGASGGSITGIYTVLVEGDDPHEPVADAARSLLDGHVMLSRELAEAGHFPAIDVLASVSRVMPDVVSEGHSRLATHVRELLATRRRVEDLVAVGAYQEGSDPAIDLALKLAPSIERFLRQPPTEASSFDEAIAQMAQTLEAAGSV
jgi:flagellum-specific ATP synthase